MQTILVVDDSVTMRRMVSAILRREHFEVLEASNGLEALELLLKAVPDALVTDLHMPEQNGIELVRAIRQHQTLRSIPILILTTESDNELKEMARVAGASAWLQKPFEDVHIVAALRRLLI